MTHQRQKTSVALLSMFSNTVLMLGKLAVGLSIHSVSVTSEAIHSGVDLVAATISFFAISTSHKPADHEHPYGHGKIENISGTVEALLIFLAAGWIIYEAVAKLIHHATLDQPAWGMAMMGVSALANLLVSTCLFKVGKTTHSIALQADAWHLRTDVWTSLGVMAGLGIILLGKWCFPQADLAWVDPMAAIIVALLILRTAWKLTVDSTRDLLDVSLPADEEAWLLAYLRQPRAHVNGLHKLRTRRSGAVRFVEFHLIVERTLSIEDAHAITVVMTREITAHFPDASVTIHVEPCDDSCSPTCKAGCFVRATKDVA
jgi:cation diffusion facilitator family transporter